ncbi:hypothetical protein FQN50_001124 [Emmonsiellopsis sp. PD_5]|nr:hypothetical protein FQN50_001124 [Emmonsiellopsis sp. PD_5]
MPPRKSSTSSRPSSRKGQKVASQVSEKLPKGVLTRKTAPNWVLCLARYSSVIVSSLTLSTVLFSLATQITRGDLAWTSKHYDSWWEVVGLLGWRTVELSVAWVLGYDARDVASLTFLTHLPTYILLLKFYGIRPTTLITVCLITLFSNTLPFHLFRETKPIHKPQLTTSRTTTAPAVSIKAHQDETILADTPTKVYTTLIATSVLTFTLYSGFATWLPTYLVSHFDGLPDLRAVHAGPQGFVSMFITLLPAGCVLRDFLFVSPIAEAQREEMEEVSEEAGEHKKHPSRQERTETETETAKEEEGWKAGELLVLYLYRKYWAALPTKTRVLVAHTAAVAVMMLLNTVVQVVGTISGAEMEGALGWGMVWSLAAGVTGWLFGWVGGVEGL